VVHVYGDMDCVGVVKPLATKRVVVMVCVNFYAGKYSIGGRDEELSLAMDVAMEHMFASSW
jgi:hypothetical protein